MPALFAPPHDLRHHFKSISHNTIIAALKNGPPGPCDHDDHFTPVYPRKVLYSPEIPIAKYKFGAMARPVCPTCSWCGRQ
jgi:hypothetical protein